ncbi:MAG TPA: hypothetical protein VN238_05570 [Solirubrobacteraceae bacterium]|nr:hypothetical protein [Solirubrobacteraceae bacterium]
MDDDYPAYQAWTAELGLLGFATSCMWSADGAFRRLWNAPPSEVGLVVIDVMLAVEDLRDRRFTPDRTDGYQETGLRLLEDLAAQNPTVFPRRAVLLSNTQNYDTLSNARNVSSFFGIPYWDKSSIYSPLMFADMVTTRLAELGRT